MKVFKLTVEERGDCYNAVNWGNQERGYKIDDSLNKVKPLLDAIKKGSNQIDNRVNFETCNQNEEIILEDHIINFLIQKINDMKWETAERALRARTLKNKLEGLSTIPDKDEKAKVE